jgi:hypothetical protein
MKNSKAKRRFNNKGEDLRKWFKNRKKGIRKG